MLYNLYIFALGGDTERAKALLEIFDKVRSVRYTVLWIDSQSRCTAQAIQAPESDDAVFKLFRQLCGWMELNHLPSFPGLHTPAVHRPQDLSHPTHTRSCFASLGSKRSLNSQEDVPEPKRHRTGRKRFRPAASETEAAQSSSGPAVSADDESELVALRRTLQQVQEDLPTLQNDQRQPNYITRGIQRDLDEARPRDTLRFLEEHFKCAL